MKAAGKRRPRRFSQGAAGAAAVRGVGRVGPRAGLTSAGAGGGRQSAGTGGAGGGRPEARRRRRVSSAGGSRSWTRRRRRPRCGASGREGALLPSRLPADRGDGGDSEAGPVTGAGPREAGGCPAPPPPPWGLPRPRPSCRRRRLLPGPRDDDTRSPPPPHPTPQRLPGPSLRQPRGLHPPSPHSPRAGPAPARAAGARGAGRLHGRRKEERRGPHPAPGGAETRSPGPGRVSPGLAGRGSGEEAAGVCTAAEPPPERPLMKARRPSSALPLAPPPPAPGPRCPWVEALGARLVPRPGPGLARDRGREPLGKI